MVFFPDEYLFKVSSTCIPWFANFANYLIINVIPSELTYAQRNKFLVNKHYYRDNLYLLKLCADQVIRRCIPKEEIVDFMHHHHSREARGHF